MAFGEETFKRALKAKLVEALREELFESLWVGVVEPPPGVRQIGYASVFTTPEGVPKIIFNDGSDVYVADIDEDLRVRSPLKLPVRGLTPSIIYDWDYGRWYLLVQSVVKSRRYGFYVLSRDFTSVLGYQDPLLVDGAEWDTGGQGFLFYRGFYGFLDGSPGTALVKFSVTGLRATPPVITATRRPYPVTVQAPPYTSYAGEPGHGWAHDGVSGPVVVGHELVFVLSVHDGFGDRGLALCHAVHDMAKDTWVAGVDYEMLIGPRWYSSGWGVGSFEYGSITDVLGRYYLLLVTEVARGGRRTLVFKLPWHMLSSRGKRLVYSLWYANSIAAGETSPAMPGFGRKTVFFTATAPGNLEVQLDPVGRNDWLVDATVSNTTRAIFYTDRSALRLRLRFSASATVTAHVVVEP